MKITLDKDYEVRCTLGTIKEIESTFKKPFMVLISEMNKLTTTEQIKLLYAGVKRGDKTVSESEFIGQCEDCLGLGELTDYLEQFVYELQYPGLTREEAQQRMEKKLKEAEKLRNSTGVRS